ncbi:MAG: nucleotide exchange factor GrpE, partial [Cyanothece sp. SIO2G6]|nr:nucleotide exchange factor GrpE [Cyanothece sp. SIO2G6]
QRMEQRKQQEALLTDLLTVLDALDRAVEHWQKAQANVPAPNVPLQPDAPAPDADPAPDDSALVSDAGEESARAASLPSSPQQSWWQQLWGWWNNRSIELSRNHSVEQPSPVKADSSSAPETTNVADVANVASIVTSALDGTELIRTTMADIMTKHQVVPIPAVGQAFDPTVMRALGQEVDETVLPNTVVKEVVRGYRWNDKVLREAQVMVAVSQSAQT